MRSAICEVLLKSAHPSGRPALALHEHEAKPGFDVGARRTRPER